MPIDPANPGSVPTMPSPPAAAPSVPTTPVEETTSSEEQMRRFEEELKNTDWGHQPC